MSRAMPPVDHAEPDRARADQDAVRPGPRIGGVRAPRRADDGRLSREPKLGATRIGRAFIAKLRALLVQQRALRHQVADALDVPPRTFEKWLAPSETNVPRFDHVLRLLTEEGILPGPARQGLLDWLCREAGRVTVDLPAADPEDAPLPSQVMQLVTQCGRVAFQVERASDPASGGGAQIIAEEARAMLPAVRDALREAAEMQATLEVIAGK